MKIGMFIFNLIVQFYSNANDFSPKFAKAFTYYYLTALYFAAKRYVKCVANVHIAQCVTLMQVASKMRDFTVDLL